jgi:pimeloyl-ACP methyl ester carboxylesterase
VDDQSLINVGDVRLAYRTWGEPGAPPIILLHGLGSDGSTWDEIAGGLADRWQLYAPDLRGHGRSSRPGTYSFELMRDDVLGLMDALDLARVSLVGHSLGGVVAYLVAEQSPGRVERLVLEEAPPPFPLGLATPQPPGGPVAFDWAVRPPIVGQLNAPDPAWWAGIPQVSAPTLVIAGGVDSHLPQGRIADMAARFPAGRLVTIPVGHGVHAVQPTGFGEAVRAFLTASP